MAEAFIHKNLADKRKEIQAYIGSLEHDLEQARNGKCVIPKLWEMSDMVKVLEDCETSETG